MAVASQHAPAFWQRQTIWPVRRADRIAGAYTSIAFQTAVKCLYDAGKGYLSVEPVPLSGR